MNSYTEVKKNLDGNAKTWLVTGVAGFIGSNLLEELLQLDQRVVGLDNFSTGHKHNLRDVEKIVGPEKFARFNFVEGDIKELNKCREVMIWKGSDGIFPVDYVLHQAALGSVPRSIEDPINTNKNNIDGFLNMIVSARDAGVKKFVYAASSSTYGDHPGLPKIEDIIGNPLSPYAVTKYVNELYANVFSSTYGVESIGLRYFNVFGRRQDPNGVYAAVIPRWIDAIMKGKDVYVNGDGETSRDFCYIANVVQANILSALSTSNEKKSNVYNVAVGDRTSLNNLFSLMRDAFFELNISTKSNIIYRDFRQGDVRHSQADISKIKKEISYNPTYSVSDGIKKTVAWFVKC